MKKIGGDLGLMPLDEILKWVDSCGKTGSLKIANAEAEKKIFFEAGTVVFFASGHKGERIGEFLLGTGCLEPQQIKKGIEESRRLGVPLTNYLLKEKILEEQTLAPLFRRLVVEAVADALGWREGPFEFRAALPPALANAPLRLEAGAVLEEALEQILKKEEVLDEKKELIEKLARRMAEGDFEIPPVPEILRKLNESMGEDGASAHEVMKIIMADQILTAKILKVVNSALYSLPNPVSSLQHAIAYVGFKAVLNIVTTHTLGNIFVENADAIRQILRHSLMCAYIAKKIGTAAGFDEEDAFVCGLLHDFGKTVLINLLEDYDLAPDAEEALIEEYHSNAGSLLALCWNLPEVVRNAVRFHHHPEDAPYDNLAAEITFLANGIAHDPAAAESLAERCSHLDSHKIDFESMLRELEEVKESIATLI